MWTIDEIFTDDLRLYNIHMNIRNSNKSKLFTFSRIEYVLIIYLYNRIINFKKLLLGQKE